VPFPPGGSTDVIARLVSPRLSELLGQSVVVENKSGAGGVIGFDATAKAPKDGYTLGMILSGLVITPMLPGGALPFDPAKDLEPVILLGSSANVLSVPTAHPAADIRALLAMAKAMPAKLTIGHAGNGTVVHLTAELLRRRGGIDLTVVPYKGGGPVVADLMGGHIDMAFNQVTTVLGHVQAGKLKALAVTSAVRSSLVPELPTIAESDKALAQFDVNTWFGLFAPAKLPAEMAQQLNKAFVDALNAPDVKARMAALLAEPAPTTPDQFGQFVKRELARYEEVVKASGAQVD